MTTNSINNSKPDRASETSRKQRDGKGYSARTTVGVCELLGGAAVTIDAVVAVE